MVKVALFVRLEAKPGREAEVESFPVFPRGFESKLSSVKYKG
jgi:hypothetical protein